MDWCPYDLEAPAKLLVPRLTPLVNEIPREKGVGTGLQYRRITGWSNSGIGGSANLSPFINSNTVQTIFGSQAFRRGPKIAYQADAKSVSYVEMGLSDQVNWQAEFASRGYQNVRAMSQTALLWATKGGEERAMLFGRGTAGNGYGGVVAAPGGVTAVGASTGGAIAAGTYYVKVTASTGFGESVVSTEASTSALSGSTNSITITVGTEPVGALAYNLYVGTSSNAETFQTTFSGNSFVLTSYAAGAVNPPGADTSADVNGFDGLLTVQSNPSLSGYVNRVNGKLSTTNPGIEFQRAFQSLWASVKADPDEVLVDATVISELGDLIKTNNSTGYRIMVQGDDTSGHQLGTVVTGLQNQVTRTMVDLKLHPWMPAGAALIRSKTLPLPDTEIGATVAMRMVQDYMSVDWPVIQFTYDASTYMYGSMVHYAPAWSGCLLGIQ